MAQNIELGIKLKFDGKDVVGGVTVSREALRQFATDAKRAGEAAAGGFTSAAQGVRSVSQQLDELRNVVNTGVGLFGLATTVKAVAGAMIDAQQASDKLRNSLEFSAGSVVNASREIEYLRGVTRTMGLDFSSASQAYAKFAASARGAGMSMADVRATFEGVSSAGARFGLSAEEMNGAFLALGQMASKGVVAMEELRGQLGERLPGAFSLAAKAMGVTQQELIKMVESGKLASAEFLPRFAQALKEVEAPAGSLTQELNRLNSAWDVWKQSLVDTDGGGFAWLARGINESSAAMRALGEEAGVVQKILVAIGGFEFGALGRGKFDTQQVQEDVRARLREIAASQREYEQLKEKQGDYLSPMMRDALRSLDAESARLRQLIAELAMRRGQEIGFQKPDLKGQWEAQRQAEEDRLKTYRDDGRYASQAAKIAQAVEEENKAFAIAVTGLEETDQRYMAALKLHQERLTEIRAKSKDAGIAADVAQQNKALQKTLNERLAVLRAEDSATGKLTATERQYLALQASSPGVIDKATEALFKKAIAREKAAQDEADYARLEAAADARRADALAGLEKDTAAIEANTRGLEEQAYVLINGKDALEHLRIARLDDAIAAERHTLALIDGSSAEAQAIRDKIAALEAEKAARGGLADAEVIARQRGAWQQFSGDIERSLTDALMRGFENGNTAGENFVKALQNTLKTAALKIVVQAIVDPVMGNVNGLLGVGVSGTGSTGSGLAGSATSNLLGTAISGYVGNGLLSAGSSALLGGTLAGSFATGAGAALVNGAGIMGNLSAAGSLIGTGTAGGIATGIGMAAPYVGAALAIASAIGLFGKGGGPQLGQYGKIDATGYSSSFTMSGGDKLGNEAMAQTAYAQAQVLFALAGKNAADLVLEQGYKMDPQGTAGSRAYRTIKLDGAVIAGGTFDGNNGAQWYGGGSDAQGAANYLGKLTTSEILALTRVIADPQLSATVARLAANFSDLNQGLAQYLVAQNAQQQLSWSLMSEEEQHAAQLAEAQRVLTQTFGDLGRAVPQSAAEFRAYVEAIDITTQAGQDQITTLTGVRDAFLFVQQSAEGAGTAVDALASAMSDMQRLASEITHIDTARNNLAAARYNVAAAMDGFDAARYWQETQDELAARLASALSTGAQLALAGELQDAIGQGYQAQLTAIVKLRDERLAALQKEEAAAQAVAGAVASLAQFADSLGRSRFSTLSPEALLDATAQRYAGLIDAAGTGDVDAITQLPTAAQEYLSAAQAFYASGSGYAEVFAGVQQSLAELSAGGASSAAVVDWQQQEAQAADAQYRQAVLDLQQQTLAQYGELDLQLSGWQRELVISLDEQMLALSVGNASLTTIATEIAALSDGIGGVIGESFTRVMTAKQQGDQAIAAAQTTRLDRLIEMQQVTVDTLADRLDAMTRRLAAIEATNRLAAAE